MIACGKLCGCCDSHWWHLLLLDPELRSVPFMESHESVSKSQMWPSYIKKNLWGKRTWDRGTLHAASDDNMEEASEQAWNQVADFQIKVFLRVVCYLHLFSFLSCPGCLFLVALASKWQCLRGAEAPVLSTLQHMLELMRTNSSVGGEGETFTWHSSACPLCLAGSKPAALYLSAWESFPSKLMDTWDRKPGQF